MIMNWACVALNPKVNKLWILLTTEQSEVVPFLLTTEQSEVVPFLRAVWAEKKGREATPYAGGFASVRQFSLNKYP